MMLLVGLSKGQPVQCSKKILLQLPVIDFPFGYHFGTCS